MSATEVVTSADGSRIGFERLGSGPPLVAVHGSTADRTRWAPVREELATSFELLLLDRRGRGLSSEESGEPYDLAREGEDIVAVLEAAEQPSILVGHSYGALASIEAALRSDRVAAVVLYEPAAATPGHVPIEAAVLDRFDALLERGDREGVLEVFFSEVVGLAAEAIQEMRGTPIWGARLAAAHTIAREARVANAVDLRPERLAPLDAPTTVLMGTVSPPWLQAAAHATHHAIAGSRFVELEGQGHMAIDLAPEQFIDEVRTAASLAGL